MSTSDQIVVTKEVSEITEISQLKVMSPLGNQFLSSYYRAVRLLGEQGQTVHAYDVLFKSAHCFYLGKIHINSACMWHTE